MAGYGVALPNSSFTKFFPLLTRNSIARYTEDYTHLDRCTPQLPDPSTSDASVQDLYKALESPRQFYATTQADSRLVRTASGLSMRYTTQQEKQSSPQQQYTFSSQSTTEPLARTTSPIQRKASSLFSQTQAPIQTADAHISADLPKAFPGLHHERHRRRSTRQNRGMSVGTNSGINNGTGTDTEDGLGGHLSGSVGDLGMSMQLQKPERMKKVAGGRRSGSGSADAGAEREIREESDSE